MLEFQLGPELDAVGEAVPEQQHEAVEVELTALVFDLVEMKVHITGDGQPGFGGLDVVHAGNAYLDIRRLLLSRGEGLGGWFWFRGLFWLLPGRLPRRRGFRRDGGFCVLLGLIRRFELPNLLFEQEDTSFQLLHSLLLRISR